MLNKKALSAAVSSPPAIFSEDVFSTFLYTGNGSTQTITNGIDLDGEGGLVWIKNRDQNDSHILTDTERGATEILVSNTTAAEATDADTLTSFNSDGFALGDDVKVNTSTEKYCSWTFRKQPKFFDVVAYTGTGSNRTVAHNLTVVPELIIIKTRSASGNWPVYSAPTGNTAYLILNTTAASVTGDTSSWNSTTPTASVFSLGDENRVNISGATFVAYLFATCAGVSKVFSYTGNGSSQTINCAFTAGARLVLIKRTDSTGDWYIWDSARGIVSGNDPRLSLNSTAAEVTSDDTIDPDSSGFVVNQVAATNVNVSSATYIGLAIA
jgi:hypothetical protein